MHFRYMLLLFVFVTSFDIALGQLFVNSEKQRDRLFEKALAAYRDGRYSEAEQQVLKSLKHDSLFIDANLLLYDISDELGNEGQKTDALKAVIEADSVNYPVCYRFLADIYFNNRQWMGALLNYEKYKNLKPRTDSAFIALRMASCRFIKASLGNPVDVKIHPLNIYINTFFDEYWPLVSADDRFLYFTRLIKHEGFAQEKLFVSEKRGDEWVPPVEMNGFQYDETNVGAVSLSADGQWLFFTACNKPGGMGSCDLFFSRKVNGRWMPFENIGAPVNGTSWEAQPSISADKQFLYFASNRKGGQGRMDLWRSKISLNADGLPVFSEPENLGEQVNTPQNDFSPFIHADGQTLYFASDGRIGMGGSDLFVTRFNSSYWSGPENLGYPVNSFSDDFGLTVSPTAQTAVFSSDRDISNNSKDLYTFLLPEKFQPLPAGYVKGFVFDETSGQHLEALLEIGLLDQDAKQQVFSTPSEGYLVTLTVDRLYSFNINKKGYLFYSHHFNLKTKTELARARQFDIYLTPIKIGQKVVLNNLFFDFDSYQLQEESFAELDQLVLFLRKNPKVEIEISGHTDNVGDEAYNQSLSENRAKVVVAYLEKTVSENRIKFKGYGATQPESDNESDEGRALNRRCEMKILKY
ncbi:MAG: OmpA family protein [Prolixibacteraceae bacterium]|nr:OmpA family protein [Prolixibacteraceae bacterium]